MKQDGMMDIARHGIFQPEHFAFNELMYIFLAVMVTDIILLDIAFHYVRACIRPCG